MRSYVFPNRILPYLLIAPSAILVVVFFIIPAFQSLQLSFYRVNTSTGRQIYVEFENFTRLFSSKEYINSLTTTGIFILVVVFFALTVSLALAVGASQPIRGFGVYRTLFIWPYALSPAIAGTIWALLADPSIGVLTYNLDRLGIHFNRQTDSTHAIIFICVAAVWKILGYNVVFFLAGLRNIPQDVLEAASLDGANAWMRFWRMKFPLLSPTTFFLLVMNTLYASFETFGLIDITTQGGPGRATNLLIYKLYNDGFKNTTLLGSAAAQSVLLLIFVAILTIIQFRTAGKRTFYR
ncbi:MAG: sugar ABC transporter permease [Anaerolineae bacterium]|nr:sugar ABC transporter permease [Anaerolineae bacterium]